MVLICERSARGDGTRVLGIRHGSQQRESAHTIDRHEAESLLGKT